MEKKFQHLGTILDRTKAKKVNGGEDGKAENRCAFACTTNNNCDSVCPNCEAGAWGNQKFCFN